MFAFLGAELASRVAQAKAPRSAEWALGRGFTPLVLHTLFTLRPSMLVGLLREQPEDWFDQPWLRIIAGALETVQHRPTARYGADPARWAWGRVRPLRLPHPAASGRRPLRPLAM